MKLTERANMGLHTHIENIVKNLSIGKNDCILDIGCGTGAFLARLSDSNYKKLHGIDISLPKENITGVSFKVLDLDGGSMPFESGAFKLIISIEVFEHIENMGTLLKEITRVIADDGILIITTPNVQSIEARLRNLVLGKLKQFDELSDPTHIYPIFVYPFARLLKRYSLEIEEVWGYPIDGTSPTSRGGLQFVAKLLTMIGLSSSPPGDHLCMKIRHKKIESNLTKRDVVASHY